MSLDHEQPLRPEFLNRQNNHAVILFVIAILIEHYERQISAIDDRSCDVPVGTRKSAATGL